MSNRKNNVIIEFSRKVSSKDYADLQADLNYYDDLIDYKF